MFIYVAFFIWAALKASFSALSTFSDNPTAINVYTSTMEKRASFPVNWSILILKVFILCVSHKKEKSKLKEVKHCHRPCWRKGDCYRVRHCSRWKPGSPSTAGVGHWLAESRSLRLWGWHFKNQKVTRREGSEFLGFNPFSNVLLDLSSCTTFSCQCCKTRL